VHRVLILNADTPPSREAICHPAAVLPGLQLVGEIRIADDPDLGIVDVVRLKFDAPLMGKIDLVLLRVIFHGTVGLDGRGGLVCYRSIVHLSFPEKPGRRRLFVPAFGHRVAASADGQSSVIWSGFCHSLQHLTRGTQVPVEALIQQVVMVSFQTVAGMSRGFQLQFRVN
jgi:hypothetical protein